MPSQTRTYFVAADHVSWSYAPDGQNDITGQPFDDTAEVFTEPGPDRIGTAYTKSLYREYADASFKTLKPRPPEWQHLGLLGPVIHAVVGDKVRIVFKNHLDRPVSIHMHGLLYDKSSEGAPYNDGTTAAQHGDDAVPPGTVHTPHWHGNTVVANGMRTDVVSLLPAQMITADMTPDDPGIWLFHCHVNNHTLAGMLTRYQVVA